MVRWNGQKWSLCWSTGAFHAQHAGMTLFASIIVSSSKTACWIYAWNDKNVRRVQVKFPCKTIEFSKGISGTVRTCCRTVPEPDLRQTGTFASVWDTFPTTIRIHAHVYPRIECCTEISVTAWCDSNDHPPYEGYCRVVVHVQEAYLIDIAFQ